MSVEIIKVNERQYSINGKHLYLDTNNNWVATEEITTRESETFRKHLESIKKNNLKPPHDHDHL